MSRRTKTESPSQRLADDYSSSAHEYARLWGPVILPMALPLLDHLPFQDCHRLLDVGTGVGGLVDQLRSRAQRAFICGIDLSEGMLRVAKAESQACFAVMDAQGLSFRAGVFDLVTMVFMLFHLPEPVVGLREVARVLRPGGSVGLTTWADDPGLPGHQIWTEELDRSGAAPDPRAASVRQHGLVDHPDKIRELLREAGLRSAVIWTQSYERVWDHESMLALQAACGTPGRRLATLSQLQQHECVERVRARIGRLGHDQLVWRSEVLFAVAKS